MTDDKGLFDAYSSMYKKEEEQLDEVVVTGSLLAAKAAMGAMKGAKVAGALGKAAKVAGKVQSVADAAGSVGDAANKIRGKGQHHPSNQQEEVEPVNEVAPAVVAGAKLAGKAALAGVASEVGSQVVKKIKGGKKEVKKEEVEGGVSVVDYDSEYTPTEIETVDIIDAPKMKGTEDLHEDEEALEERLWDQVAANLTTLGEMRGVKYQVSPFEEEIEETVEEIEEHHQKDAEGKVIEHEEEEVKSEGFNVRSPLTFSKKEEPKVDVSELEEKYACSTKKAHKRLRK
tara:strand:+ start:119 stop:976 length:858 start_codon:yes stop_codon:yes gene_type:complete